MRRIALAAAFAFLAACSPQTGDTAAMADRPILPAGAEIIAPDAPYSAERDAHADVDAAFARAAERGTRVLVLFGGNWCPDCRILSGFMEIPEFSAWLDETYEVVKVDVGRYDRNMDVAARFGFAELEGVPTVVVADAEGRIVNRGTSAEWRTARERTPQEALDYFARYAIEAPSADAETAVIARP
jgi:thiol-disulfide isomerase/thioredoxin